MTMIINQLKLISLALLHFLGMLLITIPCMGQNNGKEAAEGSLRSVSPTSTYISEATKSITQSEFKYDSLTLSPPSQKATSIGDSLNEVLKASAVALVEARKKDSAAQVALLRTSTIERRAKERAIQQAKESKKRVSILIDSLARLSHIATNYQKKQQDLDERVKKEYLSNFSRLVGSFNASIQDAKAIGTAVKIAQDSVQKLIERQGDDKALSLYKNNLSTYVAPLLTTLKSLRARQDSIQEAAGNLLSSINSHSGSTTASEDSCITVLNSRWLKTSKSIDEIRLQVKSGIDSSVIGVNILSTSDIFSASPAVNIDPVKGFYTLPSINLIYNNIRTTNNASSIHTIRIFTAPNALDSTPKLQREYLWYIENSTYGIHYTFDLLGTKINRRNSTIIDRLLKVSSIQCAVAVTGKSISQSGDVPPETIIVPFLQTKAGLQVTLLKNAIDFFCHYNMLAPMANRTKFFNRVATNYKIFDYYDLGFRLKLFTAKQERTNASNITFDIGAITTTKSINSVTVDYKDQPIRLFMRAAITASFSF